jgi:hypothetical protein
VDVPEPENVNNLDEHSLRAVFAGPLERKDTLTVQVVDALRTWGATKYMPFATIDQYQVGKMVMLGEWQAQLDEVPAYLPDPRFAGLTSQRDKVGRRFIDRATGAPVVEIKNSRDELSAYATKRPRRQPATTPLAELIIDGSDHFNWVRSADGTLLSRAQGEYDVAWGNSRACFSARVPRP